MFFNIMWFVIIILLINNYLYVHMFCDNWYWWFKQSNFTLICKLVNAIIKIICSLSSVDNKSMGGGRLNKLYKLRTCCLIDQEGARMIGGIVINNNVL